MRAQPAIEQHVETLEHSGASPSLVRQRRWALTQALTAAALARLHGPAPSPEQVAATHGTTLDAARAKVTVAELLSEDFTDWYLPWAAAGALATRPGVATSPAAARARTSALRALASAHQAPVPEHTHDRQELRTVLPAAAAMDVVRTVGQTMRPGPARTRIVALLAVTAVHPVQAGQMAELDLADLGTDDTEGWTLRSTAGDVELDAAATNALRDWLTERDRLVGALQGSRHTKVWVAVRPHMTPFGVPRPAGMPLFARGLERAYSTAIATMNAYLATHPEAVPHHLHPAFNPGVLPLSGSYELLRRSLAAVQGSPTHVDA